MRCLVSIDLMHKKYRILVVGLGYRTGLSAANFLASEEHDVHVCDIKPRVELSEIISKLDSEVTVHAANQDISLLDHNFDCIILSPGVPARIPLIQEALHRNIPVISEIELAFRFLKGYTIAITGTDGKSTTTALTHHILHEIGVDSRMGGNIGIPLINLVGETRDDSVTVIELSSYQLETIESFKPDAAAFLNLTPDHLDRYDSLGTYCDAKMRIAMNQGPDDFFIYNADDARVTERAKSVKAVTRSFSLSSQADAYCQDGSVYLRVAGSYKNVLAARDLQIMGLHNVQNVMTSLLLVQAIYEKRGETLPIEKCAAAAKSFAGLPHRMERLGSLNGRDFINDSKATTVGAVEMALKSLSQPSIFIIGGRAKGDDYSRLAAAMEDRVRAVILIGETKQEFAEIFSSFKNSQASDLEEAVRKAFSFSQDGDAIVLSPACASFDMFKNFEHRGDVFRESVDRLGKLNKPGKRVC
jgi:UDP-N-acetylmuramoylalanine--D-glutamate ligase